MKFIKTLIIGPIMALALASCTGLGINSDRLDTANKQLAAYAGEVQALVTLTDSLYSRGVLNEVPATKALNRLQEANDLIRSATDAVAANGDPRLAEEDIDKIQILVDIALDLLIDFGLDSASLDEVQTQGARIRQAALAL